MRYPRIFASLLLLLAGHLLSAQNTIRVEAPNMVGLQEQFNVTFIIEGEDKPSDFQWNQGPDFQLVWGPQKGSSTSLQIINGKRTRSSQFTFTYILLPKKAGKFSLPQATARVKGEEISSPAVTVEVVTDASSSSSQGGGSAAAPSGSGKEENVTSGGEIPAGDLFLRFSLSRTSAVIGEPITATLKLYQRVNIAGFEDARFPSFEGFWSQETEAPTNIEFRRENLDDKIYNTAVLRRYVLIPQQAGALKIDPAELVCLVNVRAPSRHSSSIFDSFFENEYRTVRKRITTPAVTVHVKQLPGGAPASFGGGVGTYTLQTRLSKDSLKTHEAASLLVTVTGKGNVSLLEAPKISFPPDMEAYDVKTTSSVTPGSGGTSGSKTFEYPFIPRSYGEFEIPAVEYAYYDVNAGKYVTLRSNPLPVRVEKGRETGGGQGPAVVTPGVERRGVKNLGEDIRYITTRKPAFHGGKSFFGSVLYWALAGLLLLGAGLFWTLTRRVAARKADVAGTRNRRATRMALRRLTQAKEYLSKNLYSAFYEELHRALLGFASDKLNMNAEDLNKENISARLSEGGIPQETVDRFVGLLDACEYARYSPEGGNEAMASHYETAVEVISSIDTGMKGQKKETRKAAALLLAFLLMTPGMRAAGPQADSLWNAGTVAYSEGRWQDAVSAWEALSATGAVSAPLYYNLGCAYFKAEHTPKAILNFERALKMDPSYSDARFNLEYAQGFIQDKIDPVPELILKTWLRSVCYKLSANAWGILSLLLLAGTLAMLLLFLLSASSRTRKVGFFTALVLFLLTAQTFLFASWQHRESVRSDAAIVMRPVSPVKSSPSAEAAKDLFVLHEGTKVKLLDTVGEWTDISLSDGRRGWIRTADLEVI